MMYIQSSQNWDWLTLHFHSWQNLMRGWRYRNIIFSFLITFEGGDYIVTLYFHSWQYLVRGWLYRDIILYHDIVFSLLTIFGDGVIISWQYFFTPDNIWWGGDYIVTLYFHSWQYLVRGWLYRRRDIVFPLLTIVGEGGDYIMTLYFHCWQYLGRGWLYRDIFSLLTIFGEGVIILWHIFTPHDIWWGVVISWHCIFIPHNTCISWGGWLYRDITFSFLTIFGEGVIIS